MVEKIFIEEMCEALEIEVPVISFDTSTFTSDTLMANIDPNGYIMHIRPVDMINFDLFFAISHELRHVWQMKKHKEIFFKSYHPREEFKNVNDYNMQLAEIDANAFAAFIIEECFGVHPLFKGFSKKVRDAIWQYVEDRVNFDLID